MSEAPTIMRILSLPDIAQLVRHVRLGLFLVLAAIGAWQIHDALLGPADQAAGHGIVAAVALGCAARLYLAKRSQFNLAAAEIERLAARNRTTK
ncbi:hypothetical protein NTJ56_17800 [Burkholderia contaminans]|uniref:hypothetical protein n=1 Tax=Burkholderia cepacia complex TaxID=87882 RepID=UPI0012D97262|nr:MULTISPECIES: hypothetical protein [Burkholderia cepacia complex]MCA7919427.1 hypothetical protein [Burkholderia contaminans]UUX37171.1 hypothetical protein NTJ56_17800 [Burkholderia contaminans]